MLTLKSIMQNGRSFCHATRDGGRRARAVGASLALIAAACFLVTNHAAVAAAQRNSGSPHPPSGPATHITTLTEDGGRLDWSARLNLIAFDRMGRDGYFDVYTMTPEGKQVTCVTCDKPELPNKQIGNPAWHPSGDFIVFQAQNTFIRRPLAGLPTISPTPVPESTMMSGLAIARAAISGN